MTPEVVLWPPHTCMFTCTHLHIHTCIQKKSVLVEDYVTDGGGAAPLEEVKVDLRKPQLVPIV